MKQQSIMKIVDILSQNEASWSELLMRSRLSRRTLSKRLDDMKKQGVVFDRVQRKEGKMGRPTVIYTLRKEYEEKLLGVIIHLRLTYSVANVIQGSFKHLRTMTENGRLDLDTAATRAMNVIDSALRAILMNELSRKPCTDDFAEEFARSEVMRVLKDIFWKSPFGPIDERLRAGFEQSRSRAFEQLKRQAELMKAELVDKRDVDQRIKGSGM